MHRCAPVRFVCKTASQSSFFMRRARPSRVTAALFTRMSKRPNFSNTCLKPAFTWSASATSILTANASPSAALISLTSSANFSSLRAATATFAPASANAVAVSRPMPCDAPVTNATLSFRLNIRLYFPLYSEFNSPVAHRCPAEPAPDLKLESNCANRAASNNPGQAGLPMLSRVGFGTGDLVERGRQTLFVFNVQRGHGSFDLPEQSGQHPPWPHFHERVYALIDQEANGLFPAHGHGDLPDQRVLGLRAGVFSIRVHIGDQRHA